MRYPSDLYDILGVAIDCTPDELKSAYRKKVQEIHPDKHPAQERPQWEERFKELGQAYHTLSDPQSRAYYDKTGNVVDVTAEQAQMHADIVQNFIQALQQYGPQTPLLPVVLKVYELKQQSITQQISALKLFDAHLAQALSCLKFKPSEQQPLDFLTSALNAQRAHLSQNLKKMKEEIDKLQKTRDLISSLYEYKYNTQFLQSSPITATAGGTDWPWSLR